jgi:hypothetical protein
MWQALLAGKAFVKDDNFIAVLFLSLTGLDFSLWMVSSGSFESIRILGM